MGKRIYRDIEIRGTVYPDAAAAARALGVTANAVRGAVRRGSADRVGLGVVGSEPMPVRVRGRVFASARDAAAHFGVTRGAVYRAINEGRAETFLKQNRKGEATSRPITIGTVSFSSMEEANRVLGFRQGYVSLAIRRGSRPAMQRILGAAMAHAARNSAQASGDEP